MSELQTLDKTYVANTYARFPVEIVSGKGSILVDSEGKEYIDLGSGIAVNALGVGDDIWKSAVIEQLQPLLHGALCRTGTDALRTDRDEEGLLRQLRCGSQ